MSRGADKVHILARKDSDGGVVADVEDAMRFIERNTRTAYCIEGLRRQNIPEYPMEAVREAITNAVMHRDWFFDGANVFVELYADRIEVISPGSLPMDLTLVDLGRKSIRRNPLIADLLHRSTLSRRQTRGSGGSATEQASRSARNRSSRPAASSPSRSVRTRKSGRYQGMIGLPPK